LCVVDQQREDGWCYRWLLCRDGAGELQVHSLVRCRRQINARPTRGSSVEFDRSWLAPQYHRALLSGLLSLRPASARPVRRVLHIGVGCGVLAMAIRTVGEMADVPEIAEAVTQDCMEMNPDALALGRAHFGLAPGPRLRLFSEPAERQLSRLPPLAYDAILLDVSQPPAGGAAQALVSPCAPEVGPPEIDPLEIDLAADALAVPPAYWRTAAAISSLRRLLRRGGLLQINTLGLSAASRVQLIASLQSSFGGEQAVTEAHCEEGNVVLAACRDEALRRPNRRLTEMRRAEGIAYCTGRSPPAI